jgi:hypothetical protein
LGGLTSCSTGPDAAAFSVAVLEVVKVVMVAVAVGITL